MADDFIQPAADGPHLAQIAARVIGRPLLLHPTKADMILAVLEGRLPGLAGGMTAHPLPADASRFMGRRSRGDGSYRMNPAVNGSALITVDGSLVNRGAWIGASSGLVSYEGIAAQVRDAMDDPEVERIVLDLNSPGGEAGGMFALAQLIGAAAKTKPVCAVVNDMACSACYGLASGATEIVASPTSMIGSIGVVLTHIDRSAELAAKGQKVTLIYAGDHKVDGNPFGPLSKEVAADLTREVGALYDQFTSLVGQGRGKRLDQEAARGTQARVFIGEEAVARGLADRVASLDDVLAETSTRGASTPSTKKGIGMAETKEAAPQATNAGFTQAQLDAARAEGVTAGAASERNRIGAILRHSEAQGREAQATVLALETDMSAEACGKVLAASPKVGATAPAADKPKTPTIAERAQGGAEIGGQATQAASAEAEADGLWAKTVKRLNG